MLTCDRCKSDQMTLVHIRENVWYMYCAKCSFIMGKWISISGVVR